MNVLSLEARVKIVSLLLEGVSIRATERLTGFKRDTIMRLSARVGRGCAILHDKRLVDLNVTRVEVDEIYAIVGKREGRVRDGDPEWVGSQYTHIALAEASRLIVTWCVGKRNADVTAQFIDDLQSRLVNIPEISSDGFAPYTQAVREFFGDDVSYGQVLKNEQFYTPKHKKQRLPRELAGIPVKKVVKSGQPELISTNLVERQNLSLRMGSARFRRASTTISKSIINHVAAVGLYVTHYNFCRIHEALKTTPAVAQGLEERPWTLEKLVSTALELADGAPSARPHCEEDDMSRWFRLDDDVINDPKILLLPEAMRWIWVAFLCIASKNAGRLPAIEIIALSLRVKVHKAAEYLTTLVTAGLIDRDETGFAPHNWDKRQFKSDVSTDRVKRFRKQERNVSETPPHTQAQTDTQSSLRSEGARAKRGARLPEDWTPNASDFADASLKLGAIAHHELLKFKDYWKAQPGQRGVKLDWDATWRNWIRNAKGPANGDRSANPRTSGHDAILAAAARAAGKIVGDGPMAGAGSAAEFPFGDGDVDRGTGACGEPAGRSGGDHDGREPAAGGVLEGEIIAPDKAAAGLSGGRRPH